MKKCPNCESDNTRQLDSSKAECLDCGEVFNAPEQEQELKEAA